MKDSSGGDHEMTRLLHSFFSTTRSRGQGTETVSLSLLVLLFLPFDTSAPQSNPISAIMWRGPSPSTAMPAEVSLARVLVRPSGVGFQFEVLLAGQCSRACLQRRESIRAVGGWKERAGRTAPGAIVF